ncbi:MAG: tRNA (adenosine(37)-N6)-dimethylallyltransferase MiaA [Spirochaetaceae bacterium]|jgi:tRNA dimethylallyltransferase|nr:tRNA (adenosine(37)-N6)-dimethylallyltransferase MiaA [Spirochaetaceae bacterium]
MPENPVPVVVLFGPTASGKTAILENLFCGETVYRAEVVSVDSMQVYRGLDIGTAKPPASIRSALPHHLIDILDPNEQFNVGEFMRRADAACAGIHKRGLVPVISGGAGFYLKNFIEGLPASPPSDAAVREKLAGEFRTGGRAPLLAELCEADPESAARIHPNDDYRLLRALEVIRSGGRALSEYSADRESRRAKYRFLLIGLEWEREELYRRINTRCSRMFRMGLAKEVAGLFDKGLTPDDPGLKAIGYKEFFVKDYDGGWRISNDIDGVEALVARNSRRYAKRQITWFKKIPDVTWIKLHGGLQEDDDPAAAFFEAARAVKRKLALFIGESGGV